MADTYQDGRDFWNKLAAPITKTPDSPQKYQPPQPPQAPVVGDIPDQAITPGGVFAVVPLDGFVTDLDNLPTELAWSVSGNTELTVQIDAERIATISYPPNWTGTETVTLTATDPTLLSGSDSVTFSVNSANDPPLANDDTYITSEDTVLKVSIPGVLGNDTDTDNDPLTAVKETDPTHGTLTLNSDGSFTYTPDTGFAGEDTFTYKANDGIADSNIATVSITVGPTTFCVNPGGTGGCVASIQGGDRCGH